MCKVVQYCTNIRLTNIYPDLSFLVQLPIVGYVAELLNVLLTLLWNSQQHCLGKFGPFSRGIR